ncbi:MAG: hypothetical protein QM784_17135 [Polyangiaceae bacterium]
MHTLQTTSLVLVAALLTACGYDNDGKDQVEGVATAYTKIDTDAEMDNLETGVGVFISYAAGGNWTLQFGCDTAKSGVNCLWDVYAYTNDGGRFYSFSELDLEGEDFVSVTSDGVAHLQPVTKTDLDGIELRAREGEPLTVDVMLDGESHPEDFIFWMRDGKVVEGASSPILELTPNTP